MMQMLQIMLEDREAERAERQANIAALQQLANNNHGNHDHPGSKLKNFQNTNPPVFSKTEEPLDTDDWLQTMENNLEVAGVDEQEKVLFATHYLAGPARAWWTSTRAMNAGQIMTWADFKLKFSKYHVPPGLIKKMRDEFRELKQGRMSVVEYRDRFLTLSRYAPDETDTTEKRKERFSNGLHDEMQTVLINIPFADLKALVDSAIQMEGKIYQANENCKRRMMHQSGPSNTPRYRPSSSGGFAPRNNKPNAPMSRPGFQNRSGGNPRPGGHPNNSNYNNNFNRAPPRAPNNNNSNTNTAPRTGSNAIPVTPKDKSTITCYECGVVGHYSNECPKRLAKNAANTAAPAQQQRRVSTGKKFTPNNRTGRLFHMNAEEAQEAPDVVLDIDVVIRLANRETISPIGIVRDVEVLCDCKKEKIVTKFAGESYEFNFSKFAKVPYEAELPNDDFRVEKLASIALAPNNPLQQHLEDHESEVFREERNELDEIFLRQPILKHDLPVEDLGTTPPPKEDPVFDLKPLPDNLKYAYIDDKKTYPVIISAKLSDFEEERLLEILKKHRGAIGYTLDDLKGISPSICQHAINMEDDAKPVVEHQHRLIPKMKDVVRNEVLKLLEAGIIYPIADSRWVSPVHCVPKKGGITVVPNDNDELILKE
ncbi:hypothetical protein QYE76_046469 [Lolium multiflorum]|uniref:CCHC-type domain-containing protein n=1 Tax=Lolium multiflorum TaxID=4521 RepID=A0AAD8X0Q1_LOLMU|nr:hypothetical protein QYE76_046469 [Lolium multiflorum]